MSERKKGQSFEEFMHEDTVEKVVVGDKYSKNKVYAKVPKNFDYLPELKGKLIVDVYDYEMTKDGKVIQESGKHSGRFSGANMVVNYAKIPLSFLIAGWDYRVGDAWDQDDAQININNWHKFGYGGRAAGRTRGLISNSVDGFFEPPNITQYFADNYTPGTNTIDPNDIQTRTCLLWNPYGREENDFRIDAQYPFYPTKMRFGDKTEQEKQESVTQHSHSILARLRPETPPENAPPYERIRWDNATTYHLEETTIDGAPNNKKFNLAGGLRNFIYVTRNPVFNNNIEESGGLDTIVESKSIYVASNANRIFNSIVFTTIMPNYDVGTDYCYDDVEIEEAELKCDAGSYGLILPNEGQTAFNFDNDGFYNFYENNYNTNDRFTAYHNQKDGITYAIRTIPLITKRPSNSFVFSWILYL